MAHEPPARTPMPPERPSSHETDLGGLWNPGRVSTAEPDVMTYYRRSCAAAGAGDNATAVSLLREALDLGLWYGSPMLRQSPSLMALKGEAAFEAVVQDSLAAAQRAALLPPPIPVEFPTGPAPYPAVLALHGNGGSAEESMRAWQPVVASGWMLAAAASSQWIASARAVRDDEDRADREVLDRYGAVASEIDPARFVVVGFSMGAETGLRLALTGQLPAVGVIAVATAGPRMANPDAWLTLIASVRNPPPRVYLIVGALDDDGRRATKHRRLADQLIDGGIPTRLEVLPTLDHDYPGEFAPLIHRALAFINTDGSSGHAR